MEREFQLYLDLVLDYSGGFFGKVPEFAVYNVESAHPDMPCMIVGCLR